MTDIHLAAPTAPEELRRMFVDACNRTTDINGHLTVMRDTASGQRHITEMGVGSGQSTLAWLLVQPEKLICYDWGFQDCVPTLRRVCGKTEFRFYVADSRLVEIEPTDLLFIDTNHNYGQLKEELHLHADKVRNYIVLHDTTTFADHGEDGATPGIWQAVEEFLYDNPHWKIVHRHLHNNGLTILGRDKMNLHTLCKVLNPDDYVHLKDEVARIEHGKNIFAGVHRFDHEHRAWEYGICLAALGGRKAVKGKWILDVGGGDSVLGGVLAWGGADVTVAEVSDYSEHTAEMGRRAGAGSMSFIQGDFTHGMQSTFDAVFCVSVIEHTQDPEAFFESLCAAVKPGGVLVLTCDFHPSAHARIQGHERTFNAERLLAWAKTMDFEPIGTPDYTYHGDFVFDRYSFASLALRRLP